MRRLRRLARKVAARAFPPRPGAVILGYHRVAEPSDAPGGDPFHLCTSPTHFDEHMTLVRRLGRPVSLIALLEALDRGDDTRGWIAVTFDDGYDDVRRAVSSLEKHGIPTTVFFVAEATGTPFWWDVLAALECEADPARAFRVRTATADVTWPGGDPKRLRVRLHRLLRRLEPAGRTELLARLAAAWGVDLPEDLPRALTEEAARGLIGVPGIEAGAHTLTHPPLAEVSRRRARREIFGCRERLADRFGAPPVTFSYPHGSRSPSCDALVTAAGFRLACVSSPDSVRAGCERYSLPRIWPGDVNGQRFRRIVGRYVGGNRPR